MTLLQDTTHRRDVIDVVGKPVTLAVLHPKGGVGRSTTVWHLGAELALRGKRVRIEDLDQAKHLSAVFGQFPLGLDGLQLTDDRLNAADRDDFNLVLLDTAPEADRPRALGYLQRADWVLVPVKGPEQASVQALPMLMDWIREASHARLLGFLPTMHKARRSSARHWLEQLHLLAVSYQTRVFAPIGDLASIADWQLTGHPYAHVAEQVLRATGI
jgi:cellulose biosynthesis protein BcsQ